MHEKRGERPRLILSEADRIVESAVLAILTERHPQLLSTSELVAEMAAGLKRPGRAEEVERAVGELIAVGLLRRREALLEPTPAARRMAELELGLGPR